jgi:hypothetical protein
MGELMALARTSAWQMQTQAQSRRPSPPISKSFALHHHSDRWHIHRPQLLPPNMRAPGCTQVHSRTRAHTRACRHPHVRVRNRDTRLVHNAHDGPSGTQHSMPCQLAMRRTPSEAAHPRTNSQVYRSWLSTWRDLPCLVVLVAHLLFERTCT